MYFDETAIVESLIDKTAWFENSRNIAILASSYSDDVIAFAVKKIEKSFGEIPQDLAEKLFLISFPCFQFIRKIL